MTMEQSIDTHVFRVAMREGVDRILEVLDDYTPDVQTLIVRSFETERLLREMCHRGTAQREEI